MSYNIRYTLHFYSSQVVLLIKNVAEKMRFNSRDRCRYAVKKRQVTKIIALECIQQHRVIKYLPSLYAILGLIYYHTNI